MIGNGGVAYSEVLDSAFERYRRIIFKHAGFGLGKGFGRKLRGSFSVVPYDITALNIILHSDNEEVIY